MIPTNKDTLQADAFFYLTFYKLKKYCEESIFKIERATDEKNIELLNLLSANSFNLNSEIQARVQEALIIKRKIEIFQMIFNQIKFLANNHQKFTGLANEFPQVFETLIWLLKKFKTPTYLNEARKAIATAYGTQTLTYLEQFKHINLASFEKNFDVEINNDHIKKYITQVQSLYMPQNISREGVAEEGKAHKPPQVLDYGQNSQNPQSPQNFQYPQNIQNVQNPINYQRSGSIPQDTAPINSVPQQNYHNNALNNQLHPNYLPHYNNMGNFHRSNNVYEQPGNFNPNGMIRVDLNSRQNSMNNMSGDGMALMGQSNVFDFNKPRNNLQISILKGLKKDNIEFYDQIEPALRASGDVFADETFPPEISSLTSNVSEFKLAEKVVWKRISEVYRQKNITLCSDKIGPNDINQGRLGDCYFLSALSVLSEQKNFIKRLFHSKEVSSTGCYSVWLCDSGEWRNVIIDDFVPCTKNGSEYQPCFSKSKSSDIWVLLLEKAFAKLYGNYHNIDGGYQSEALAGLTGAPTKYFKLKENGINPLEQTWLFMTGSLQNHFILTGASRGKSQFLNKSMGIVSDHAYAILDAKEVQQANGNRVKLIKIRNPWGNHEWQGDWGDNSPLWTPEIKKFLKYESKAEDGIFWMSLVDFDTHFDSICSCEIHHDYYFSFIKLGENRKQNYFLSKMSVSKVGYVYLTVQQKMKKHFRKAANYDYSFVRVIVAKLDQNGRVASIVHGKYKNGQSIVIRKNFQQGEYLIFIEVDWTQKIYNEINVTAYSKVKVDMSEEPMQNYNIPMLYQDLIKAYIFTSGNTQIKTKQYEHNETKFNIHKYKVDVFGVVCILLVNKEKNVVLNNRLDLKRLANMDIYLPQGSSGHSGKPLEVTVPPGQERVILLKAKVLDVDNTTFAYEYSEIFKLTQNYSAEELKRLCKEKGQKIQTLKGGQIETYSYKFLGGFADYYINKGPKGVLQEEVTFEITNILVNGQETNRLEIFVPPGEDFLIDMRIKNVYEASKCNRKTKSTVMG